MATFVDPLIVGRVIGDVLDIFVPTISMSVNYGAKQVNNGCEVKASMAISQPNVQISGLPSDLYTLVMTDPDAPSPSEPIMRELLHWVVVDIPGGADPTKGYEVVAYMGPRPHVGIHRYVFILFQQKAPFPPAMPPATRANFSTREFAAKFKLGMPVASMFFNCQKEPLSRRT